MGGKLKNRKQVSIIMDIELADRLDECSKMTMAPKSRIIERAVREYLERIDIKNKAY